MGALKSRDMASRNLTTRHQIKQIATGWTSAGPRKNWTCWTISELNPVCHDSTAALIVAMRFLCAVSHSVGAHTVSLQPRVDNRSNSNSSEDEDENRHGASCASSANFRGVGIGKSSRSNNLGRLLRSVHRGATCWLRNCCRADTTRRQYTRRRYDDKENF